MRGQWRRGSIGITDQSRYVRVLVRRIGDMTIARIEIPEKCLEILG
jgi:hypothetical protein